MPSSAISAIASSHDVTKSLLPCDDWCTSTICPTQRHVYQSRQTSHASGHHSWRDKWFRLEICIVIFITTTILAACIGCLIGLRLRKKRVQNQHIASIHDSDNLNDNSPSYNSNRQYTSESSDDAYRTSRTRHLLHHSTFASRELKAYQHEKRERSRMQRSASRMRGKQGVLLPVQARHLTGRVRGLVRSFTRSNPDSEPDVEPRTIDAVLEVPTLNLTHDAMPTQSPQRDGDDSQRRDNRDRSTDKQHNNT